jgi:hypothetical protein
LKNAEFYEKKSRKDKAFKYFLIDISGISKDFIVTIVVKVSLLYLISIPIRRDTSVSDTHAEAGYASKLIC